MWVCTCERGGGCARKRGNNGCDVSVCVCVCVCVTFTCVDWYQAVSEVMPTLQVPVRFHHAASERLRLCDLWASFNCQEEKIGWWMNAEWEKPFMLVSHTVFPQSRPICFAIFSAGPVLYGPFPYIMQSLPYLIRFREKYYNFFFFSSLLRLWWTLE